MNMIFLEFKATTEKLGFSGNCGFQLFGGGRHSSPVLCATPLVASWLDRGKGWLIFVWEEQKEIHFEMESDEIRACEEKLKSA